MGDQENKVAEMVYHVRVESKRGAEHDDEDAFALLQAKRSDIEAAGAQALFNRSFGSRGQGGVSTTITFVAPKAAPKKTQIGPDQFFPAETDLVNCSSTLVAQPEDVPPLPKGAAEVSGPVPPQPAPPEAPNVAG